MPSATRDRSTLSPRGPATGAAPGVADAVASPGVAEGPGRPRERQLRLRRGGGQAASHEDRAGTVRGAAGSSPGRLCGPARMRRSLYDHGTLVQASPAIAGLVPGQRLSLAPKALEQLGVVDGDEIRIRSESRRARAACRRRRERAGRLRRPAPQRGRRRRAERHRAARLERPRRRGAPGDGPLMGDPALPARRRRRRLRHHRGEGHRRVRLPAWSRSC